MIKSVNHELVQKLVRIIRSLREHVRDSHLASTLEQCASTLDRQNNELIHLHQENDELRQRLVKAQQGLVDAREAILKLKGDRP